MEKVIVLLSGGLDSSVLLASQVKERGNKNVIALNVYYGQRHHKEQESATRIALHYGVQLISCDLSEVFRYSLDCALLENSPKEIPKGEYAKQLQNTNDLLDTYVPFRNGLFLSYATSLALQLNASRIYYGAHADDVAGNAYPDCTKSFIDAMCASIIFGTGHKVRLMAPFYDLTKKDVVNIGLRLNVPFHLTWSCYEGKDKPCRICGTCIDREKAFEANGVKDPLLK